MERNYTQPTLNVVAVVAERGFELSNSQQQPSPWEDM